MKDEERDQWIGFDCKNLDRDICKGYHRVSSQDSKNILNVDPQNYFSARTTTNYCVTKVCLDVEQCIIVVLIKHKTL